MENGNPDVGKSSGPQRGHWDPVGHDPPLVDRTQIVSAIVDFVCMAHAAARNLDSTPRLVVLKGGAGVGKTVLLEELLDRLKTAPVERCGADVRVTEIINMMAILDDTTGAVLKREMDACANTPLVGPTLALRATQMQAKLRAVGETLIVLVDDLETLNTPLPDPVRSAWVRDAKNLLLRPLLQLPEVPVVIIAAARSMPNEPLAYLAEMEFQDALHEIIIVNTPGEVKAVLEAKGTTATNDQVTECEGSLLVADWRDPANWSDQGVIRQLVNEMLSREPAAQRVWFELLLTALSKKTSAINASVIQGEARRLGFPVDLQQRIVARLLAAGFLENDGALYRIYPPLANLLRQL